jgi:hypothetical protein
VPFDQHAEKLKGARANSDPNENTMFIQPEETTPVETEALELGNLAGGVRLHASASPRLRARPAMTQAPPLD